MKEKTGYDFRILKSCELECFSCDPLLAPMLADAPVYTNGVEEGIFKVGMCLPAGPYVSDDDVKYIVESIKEAIVG